MDTDQKRCLYHYTVCNWICRLPCCCSACSPPTTATVIMKTFTTSGNLLEIEPDKKPAQTNYLCVHFDIISHYWCGPRCHKLLDTTAISRNISEYHENPILINHLDIKQDRINSYHCPTLPPSQYSSTAVSAPWQDWFITSSSAQARGSGGLVTPWHHSRAGAGQDTRHLTNCHRRSCTTFATLKCAFPILTRKTLNWFDSEYQITHKVAKHLSPIHCPCRS